MRRSRLPFSLALALLLCVALFGALSLTGPNWNSASPFTNSTLNCSWSVSVDTIEQNVTILRNGAVLLSVNETGTSGTLNTSVAIDPANTTKSDVFLCRVILGNGTATTQANASVTILNSPPTTEGAPAGIFGSGLADVGFLIHIAEDEVNVLDVNATDQDGDTLSYLVGDEFCVRNSSSSGIYTCSPTQADLESNNATTLVNITFTVTDGQNVGGRTITFNLTPVNDAPSLTLSTQNTPVNQSKNMTFTAADEETDYPLSLQIIAPAEISDRLTITPLNGLGTSFSVYYDATTPDFNDVGVWSVMINATDLSTNISGGNDSRSGTANFTFNITAVGRNPYFLNITPTGPYQGMQGQALQVNITANDSDVNTSVVFTDNTVRFAISTVNSNTSAGPASGQINFTPTNADVGLYNVTITITDVESLTNTTVLTFNISNVNDAPVINEISSNSTNTPGAVNASNLTGYSSARFTYAVNATDPDSIHGDSLVFSDNTTLFAINTTTGIIDFTPNSSQVGNHHINITVIDAAGLNASRTINLTINPNSPPFFNATVPDLNCTTGALCSTILGQYAQDPDGGDNVSNFTLALNATPVNLAYNTTTGVISFAPNKTDIGHYLVNLTVSDRFGATNATVFTLRINNTPVAPNLTRFNLSTETIVETHAFTYELRATDEDFFASGAGEIVNFTTNLSINHTVTPMATQNSTARALLSFTPLIGDAGNRTIAINATDAFGLVSQRNVTFEIFADVPPPNITRITPWGADNSTHDIQTSYANTTESQFLDLTADVGALENTTVLFNVTVNDTRPVTYVWTVNGTTVSSAQNYTRAFTFFSSGRYIVYVNATNDRLESSGFTWDVTVANVNRAPLLLGALTTPLSVNGTATYVDYFLIGNGTKFIDPDDDLDSSSSINGNESSTLTFAANQTCSVADLSTSSGSLTITGSTVGACVVGFTATDAESATLTSGAVNITIIDIPEPTPSPSPSGGGGGSSSPTYIPVSRDRETPKAFSLIAPELVTIHQNETLEIPIIINNTWRDDLDFIRLSAEVNATGVTTRLSSDIIEHLPANTSQELTLIVEGYRLGENYEVRVLANVSEPPYDDSALILLNSLQRSSDGDSADVKVTFANDLLSEHPECQELNEVLDRAKERLAAGDYAQANQLVDGVINGCKYLVSTQQRIEERPGRIDPIISLDDLSVRVVLWSSLAFVLVVSAALIAYYHYTRKPEEDI